MKNWTGIFTLALLLIAFAAPAQFEQPPIDEAADTPAFESLDIDGDGHISREEASSLPCLAENFDYIESASADGLNRSEFNRAVQTFCSGW